MSSTEILPSVVVGFGKNYYRNFGPAQQSKLRHIGTLENESYDIDSPLPTTVSSYQFTQEKKENEKEDNDEQPPPPPWEQENDPLVDVQCTSASSYFLTQAGKIYNCGTVHGHVRPSLTQMVIQLPLKCVQLATGRHFCIARMEGGLAVCAWGAGHFGQLGLGVGFDEQNGEDTTRSSRSSPPSFVSRPALVEALLPHMVGSPVSSIAAGYWHSMALTKDGSVFAWGCNRNAQCGKRPSSKEQPTICQPQRVSFEDANTGSKKSKIRKIAAGRSHSVALDEGGHIYAWGANQYGQCGMLTRRRVIGVSSPKQVDALTKVRIVDVSAGDMHTLALTGGGRVFGWGGGFEGQLGTGYIYQMNPKPKLVHDLDFVAIDAGQEWKTLQKLRPIPQVIDASTRSLDLDNTPRIISVTAKGNSSFAISSTGHLYAWGCNDVGHLGLPKPDPSELTYSDPGDVNVKLSTIQRQFHTFSFDSSHNVALPQRLDSLRHLHIKSVGASSTFMWCLGTKRKDDKAVVGRTLYEIQEEKRKTPAREQDEQLLRTMDNGTFGIKPMRLSSLVETDANGKTDQKEDQAVTERTRPEKQAAPKPSTEIDETNGNACDDKPTNSVRAKEEGKSKTVPATVLEDSQVPSSSSVSEKKKRGLFSPKKIVKAFVRRASNSNSFRGDRTSMSTTDPDASQKSHK